MLERDKEQEIDFSYLFLDANITFNYSFQLAQHLFKRTGFSEAYYQKLVGNLIKGLIEHDQQLKQPITQNLMCLDGLLLKQVVTFAMHQTDSARISILLEYMQIELDTEQQSIILQVLYIH
jgi:hypothetical protein